MKHLIAFTLTPLIISLCGCGAIGAIGAISYDVALDNERFQCENLVSMSDRQSCMQRVNTANRQAQEARKKQ
jgi:hypothetical protein